MRRRVHLQASGLPDSARFLIAGGFAASVNWLVRFPLSTAMPFGAAVGLAYMIGMSAGFPIYRQWVFPGSALPLATQMKRFLAVNAFGAVIVLISAFVLASVFRHEALSRETSDALGHGLAIGIGAVANFLGHKFVTFAVRRGVAEA